MLLAAAPLTHAQALRWSRAINGPASAVAHLGDGRIITRSLAADSTGNVVVTGSTPNGANTDFLTTKLAAGTGAIAWQKVFAGAAARDDDSHSVAIDAAGNALVVGMSIGATTSDIKVIKYAAADGAILWERTIDAGSNEAGYFVAVDAAGNALIGGESFNGINWDVRVLKLAAAGGATLWEKSYDTSRDDFISDLQVDAGGNALVLGASVNAAGNDDIKVSKFSAASGALLWQQTIDGGASDEGYSLAVDSAGNALLAGYSATLNGADFVTAKLAAATGAVLWQQAFDGGQGDSAQSIAVDAAGNALVTGQSQFNGRYVFKTIKYAGVSGAVLWEKMYDAGTNAYAYQVVADSAGNAVVSGSHSVGAQPQLDWKTIVYASADGAVLLEHEFAGSARQNDEAYAAVAVPGGVVVAGSGVETGVATGVRVLKLSTGASAFVATTDLDGDARSDILYRNDASGQVYRMLMNGQAIGSAGFVYNEPDTAWKIVADGDFNGDGRGDLLWRNDVTGQVSIVLFGAGGVPVYAWPFYTEPSAAWKIVAAPDLDGDGKSDILWTHSQTGEVYAMLMDGVTIVARGSVYREPNADWKIVAVGDFGASGRQDQLLWRNATTGQVFLMTVNAAGGSFATSGQVIYVEPDTAWKIVGAADFNGDGRSDILWRNDSSGQVFAMPMNGAAIAGGAVVYREANPSWKIVALGDYNGDGRSDILWRNEATGQVYMMLMDGLAIASAGMVYAEPDTAWKVMGPREYAR